MKSKVKYNPEIDRLIEKEISLLEKACKAVEKFVSKSDKINKVNHKTRDAHATPYSTLKGIFLPYENFEEIDVLQNKKLDCIIRISNAYMKKVSQKMSIPAYGFSVKLSDGNQTIANLPLVNFPLFPINNVSRFLKIFTSINYFFAGHLFKKLYHSFGIFKNFLLVSPSFFHPSFLAEVFKFIKKSNNFILSFDYHSIGVYRFGKHLVKFKLVPIDIPTKTDEKRIDSSIENYIKHKEYKLELMVQFCYDLKDQPVNILNKMWTNSEFVSIGKVVISELINKNDTTVEAMSFNPFENISDLLPVGKIQKLRDEAYKTSFKIRNESKNQ